ncbi:MAG: hypothetical protein JWM52_401 [Candidatus Saccharibacteria bacterium]|nr:hypothetical protein [Candidatus Saccharibacteria bacterium]
MTNPGDYVSDGFDPSSLLEPTSETLATFQDTLLEIDALSPLDHTTSVEVDFDEPETGFSVSVYCSVRTNGPLDGAAPKMTASLSVSTEHEGKYVSTSTTVHDPEQKEVLDMIVLHVKNGLEGQTEAEWLESAYQAANLPANLAIRHIVPVQVLLESSPFEKVEHTEHIGVHQFKDGSNIYAAAHEVNAPMMRDWPESLPLRTMRLTTPDDTIYEYDVYVNGTTKLLIDSPATRIPREIAEFEQSIGSDLGNGLSFSITGSPEFMQGMTAGMQARLEAQRLGLDVPTEGMMKDFIKALQASLRSGVIPEAV